MKIILLTFDRFVGKLLRVYRKYVFLAKINSQDSSCKVTGCVHVKALNVTIGKNVTISPDVTFWGDGKITLGDNVEIGNNTIIFASNNGGVSIGNDVLIAAHCYIIDSDHTIKKNTLIHSQPLTSEKIIIENDVWVAENCTILKGSIIKKGAVIGAKSLVKGMIDEYGVAVGIPAKIIKYRE